MPALDRSGLALRLRRLLVSAANPGGGWAYYAGKGSRIEPTAWALLALAAAPDGDAASWPQLAGPHLQFLANCQRADGLLIEASQSFPNFTSNGLAALVLAHLSTAAPSTPSQAGPRLASLLEGLALVKGVKLENADPRQDDTLQGWPWTPGTFSWLEPTCWCVLALKKTRADGPSAAAARIQEADKLIANRCCDVGGWNFGNASVIGQDLRPYVPTTALGLIALQDRRTDPAVVRSIAYLSGARLSEPSATALALAALCLRLYGLPADDVEARLAEDLDRAERVGNLQALAMALYAMSAAEHHVKAFDVV